MATNQVTTDLPSTVKDIHNEMLLYLNENILDHELSKIKNLFMRNPLTPKEVDAIKTVYQLFDHLEKHMKIAVGEYQIFVKQLQLTNKKLARYVTDQEEKIKKILKEADPAAMDVTSATRQSKNAAVKDTLNATAANTGHTKEFHPDLVPMIEKMKARIKREKEEKKFVDTKAFNDAKDKLQKNRVVVIKGNTGDGKTATAIQLLHWLSVEDQGRNPLQLHKIEKFDLLAPKSQLVTFIDDIFGEKDVGKNDVQEWNKRIQDVQTLFVDEQTQANFLLITIRNEVFKALEESSLGTVFTKENIVDLSCHIYNIADEKRKLLELYKPKDSTFLWTDQEKENILTSAPKIGFPQCCQLFCNSRELQKERDRFFEKPFKFLKEAMSKLRECSAILFLFLNNGIIRVKDLDPNSEKVNKDLLGEAFSIKLIKGENKSTTFTDKAKVVLLKEELDRLLGFLVVKEKDLSGDDVYIFDHDSILVTVALLYGEKTTTGYIRNCPSKFLSYITTSNTSTDLIVISSDHYTDMCERLRREFESDRNDYGTSIGSLDVWKDCGFVERFVRLLDDKLAVLNKACSYGAKECALYLLSKGVKPDEDTPWWSLITGDCYEFGKGDVDILMKVDVYLDYDTKKLVLNEACSYGAEECALYLLSHGVKPEKDTILCAVSGGRVNVLKPIVNGLDVKQQWMKLAALNGACQYGSEECALYLLSEGVKPDNYTPLCVGKGGCVNVLKTIVGDLNDEIKLAVLNEACESGSEECALYLLSEGVKPNNDTTLCLGKEGCVNILKAIVGYLNDEIKLAVLNEACKSGSEECALYLLSEGVKPDNDTPLCVGKGGCVNVLKTIVGDLNDEIKLAVLNEACESGSEECALYLLSDGVKPDKNTPLCVGKGGCVNVLKTITVDLNDEIKLAVLNRAFDSCSTECVLYLLSEGVKPDKNSQWWSLITGRKYRAKGNVDVLRRVVIYLNDEMKLPLLNKACKSGSAECALYLLSEGVKPHKDTPWWSLITGGRKYGKGDVDVLRNVVIYLNDEMKLAVLNKACKSGSDECALYLLSEGVKPHKDTSWLSLITGGRKYGKGDVDVLRNVVIYLNDEMKLDVLNKACKSRLERCALYLLSEGVKPDKDTALWSLITGGRFWGRKDVDVLRNVFIYLNDELKLAVLNKACESGSEKCALYLLSEGVKPDKDTPLWSLITGGRYGGKEDVDVLRKVFIYLNDELTLAVLNKACESGSEKCILYLLSEALKPDNVTPLCVGVGGCVNVIKNIVGDLNDEIKLAVLNKACESGSEECALYLLAEGLKPDKDTPLLSLITGGGFGMEDVDVLRKVVIYLNDEMKLAVLNRACEYGAEKCALYLLSEGVNPDEVTPLWSLITGGSVGIGDVDVLGKVVIYLNDEMKRAVLNIACLRGAEECAIYLLSKGVKPDKDTPWWSLITRGEYGKGDVIVLMKVVIYLNDEMKLAVLHEACESGSEECSLYLLSEGVIP